jgi:DNA modification methylase
VWIVGDAVIDGGESGSSFKQALFFQSLGMLIHDTMIYEKNSASYPANDKSNRYTQIFEYMFVFSKGKPKTVNLIKDRKNRYAGMGTFGQNSERQADGELKRRGKFIVQKYGYRNNIFRYNTGMGMSAEEDIAYEHPAIFPEALAADHIHTWSKEGDLVYDPFGGSGTTAKMAHRLKRNWILSEISKEYCEIAHKRIAPTITQHTIF